ncbi:hypothetical protein [Erythrobacter litoralis]|uniref:Lipoprotein n=1 Tax=Erythrobacter litoralis (strain HTCC2594) TaxID=314225 RepID=Q2NCM8_ERYLH|nr:hypothetical protein [Erythrobacter litoralis]ABC62563.1 hypothetical protein ELI_02355 [Erythrobacter litoralis HTCC2594]
MRSFAAAICAALLLTGCVEKIAENRVENALLKAGLSQRNSACMAERMVDRLTIAQLRKLEALRGKPGEPIKPRTLRQFVDRVRAVGDNEVLAVTSTSAALCATGLANEARRD